MSFCWIIRRQPEKSVRISATSAEPGEGGCSEMWGSWPWSNVQFVLAMGAKFWLNRRFPNTAVAKRWSTTLASDIRILFIETCLIKSSLYLLNMYSVDSHPSLFPTLFINLNTQRSKYKATLECQTLTPDFQTGHQWKCIGAHSRTIDFPLEYLSLFRRRRCNDEKFSSEALSPCQCLPVSRACGSRGSHCYGNKHNSDGKEAYSRHGFSQSMNYAAEDRLL